MRIYEYGWVNVEFDDEEFSKIFSFEFDRDF